jgi:hypothetical protein
MKFWITLLAGMCLLANAQVDEQVKVSKKRSNLDTGFRVDRLTALERKIAHMEAR